MNSSRSPPEISSSTIRSSGYKLTPTVLTRFGWHERLHDSSDKTKPSRVSGAEPGEWRFVNNGAARLTIFVRGCVAFVLERHEQRRQPFELDLASVLLDGNLDAINERCGRAGALLPRAPKRLR